MSDINRSVLITGATGDTGRAAVRAAVDYGLRVRAMVHREDARSEALGKIGAEIVIGDLLEIDTVLAAMRGVDAAYMVWPVQPGLIHATVNLLRLQRRRASPQLSTSPNARQTGTPKVILVGTASSLSNC